MGFLSWLFGASKESEPIIMSSGTKRYAVDIVGESHYQGALGEICGGLTEEGYKKIVEAALILEDNNPHDDKAVRIEIDGITVGYLNRENAREYRRRLETAGQNGFKAICSAMIVGGWDRGGNDKGTFGVKLDIPLFEQHQVEHKVTTKAPAVNPITANFSFSIEQVNIEELARAKIGDLVNIWASSDAPTRIVIYPSGGQGDWLGLAPPSCAKLIADHRSLNLPIEAEIIEKTSTSCRIGCRLVSIEEMNLTKKDQKDTLRDALIESYKPRKAIAADFSFAIEQVNIEELDFVILGDKVYFWASVDEPRKIVIFRRGSIGGQGRLGFAPPSYATLIADHRSLNLPIETEVIEKTSTSCRIGCRLVSIEEVNIRKKEQQDKLRDELNKPYKPRKPMEFSLYAEVGMLSVGEQLQLAYLPSIEECISDINGVVLVISSMDGTRSFEKNYDTAILKKLVRLARTFKSIRIAVTSKSDRQMYVGTTWKSEYKVQVVPIEL